MKSLWNATDAAQMVDYYQAKGITEDLALRVYSSRLLGSNRSLVLHGGGNTSCKSEAVDVIGMSHAVLHIKGSGWDLDSIEPEGLPAVKLDPLLKSRSLSRLSDESMVALQRVNLLEPKAPNPSVETLLHAFLPQKFVDHTHSTAILALVDQKDSRRICDEVFGNRMGFVPYVMPGFELAKRTADIFDDDPDVEGLILDKHGIITFGDTALESYERMIHAVSQAEEHIASGREKVFVPRSMPASVASPEQIAPLLRGVVARSGVHEKPKHQIAIFRCSEEIMAFANGDQLERYANQGVSTPDLSIRIKNKPLILPPPKADCIDKYSAVIEEAVRVYVADYLDYFERHNSCDDIQRTVLSPMPRVAIVPGVGVFAFGDDLEDANINADVAEVWIEAVTAAERIGRFSPVPELELFKLEYWSLEQAKLAGTKSPPLNGQIAIVTGGASGIGEATARIFAENGAQVVIADLNASAANNTAASIGKHAVACACDVTDNTSVRDLFETVTNRFGGVDILISNAGSAVEGDIATLAPKKLRDSFELNFFAHQRMAQFAVSIMRRQGTGGVLLFNTSKQAINPGENFGAYGLPKAATLFLSRQYALECGKYGIRANAVNADRVRSGLLDKALISRRSEARGLSETEYMSGNLLKKEVRAADVAQAFLHLALAECTTGGVTTVDGGNIAATLR